MLKWESALLETHRGTFEVFICGKGDPVCVTHLYSEFNERGNYFADIFTKSYQVILVNLKEAGRSDKAVSEDELSMLESVQDLEAIREKLGYRQWIFGGHSTGGMLGLVYGIHFSESLKALVIGGAAASNEYMNSPNSMYSKRNPHNERVLEILNLLKDPTTAPNKKKEIGKQWTQMSLYRPERFDQYFAKPSSGKVVPKRLDYYSYKELPTYDVRDKLDDIKASTFIYCGKHDSQCPVIFSEEIHRLIPQSKMQIFESSNHSPFLEEAGLFEEKVYEFLRSI